MEVKIDSMHFVFWFKQWSFAIPQTKFADFLNKFADLIIDGSQYILPINEEAPWDISIMSLDWKDTRIVISKDRLNVFFENHENWWDLSVFLTLIKKIYWIIQLEEQKEWIKIWWIWFVTYNHLQDISKPLIWSYFLDFLDKEKWSNFLDWDWVNLNIRLEQKKELEIGKCNFIINIMDVKTNNKELESEEKNIPLLVFDMNTKPKLDFTMNEANLDLFFSVYQKERQSTFKLFQI